MDDLISRQAVIEALLTAGHINLSDGQAYFLEKALNEIPSAQPTLYGYRIEHLALIARGMEKEGVTPEKAVETFGNISRIVQIIVEELRKMIRKAGEEWGT